MLRKLALLAQSTPAPGTAPQKGPGGFPLLIRQMGPLLFIFGIMYLLFLRPQQKKANEHREMVSRLKVGDAVLTNGGIYGTVTGVTDTKLKLSISEDVEIEIVRSAIASVVESKAR